MNVRKYWFKHYFKVNGTFTPLHELNSLQIAGLNDKVLFYNLYCCYACEFNQTDNLGTAYLFNSNYTLGVFGSTRSGGFLLNYYLYYPLRSGKSLGEAFREWWYNDVYEPTLNHGPNDVNMMGNVLMGDPTLRIRDPPTEQANNSPSDENNNETSDEPQIPNSRVDISRIIIGSIAIAVILVSVSILVRKKQRSRTSQ